MENELVSLQIENKIIVIRGVQVMLDRDLAELYGVETKVLNQTEETKVTNDVADNKKGTEANAPQSINEKKESVINSQDTFVLHPESFRSVPAG